MEITITYKDDVENMLERLIEAGMTPQQLAEFILEDEHWFLEGLNEDTCKRLISMLS